MKSQNSSNKLFMNHEKYGKFFRDKENNLSLSFEIKPNMLFLFLNQFEKFLFRNKKLAKLELEIKNFEFVASKNRVYFIFIFEKSSNIMTLKDYLINLYNPSKKEYKIDSLMFLLKLTHFGISIGYKTLKEESELGYLDHNDIFIKIKSVYIEKREKFKHKKHFGKLIYHDYEILGIPDLTEFLPFIVKPEEYVHSFQNTQIYYFNSQKYEKEMLNSKFFLKQLGILSDKNIDIERKLLRRSFLHQNLQFVLKDCSNDKILKHFSYFQINMNEFSFQANFNFEKKSMIFDKVDCLGKLILYADSKGKILFKRDKRILKLLKNDNLLIKNRIIKLKNKYFKYIESSQILFLIIDKCFETKKNSKVNIRFFRELLPEIEKSYFSIKKNLQINFDKKIDECINKKIESNKFITKTNGEEFSFKKKIEYNSKSSESKSTSNIKSLQQIKKEPNLVNPVSPNLIDYIKKNCLKSNVSNITLSQQASKSISDFINVLSSRNSSMTSSISKISSKSINSKLFKSNLKKSPSFYGMKKDLKKKLSKLSKSQKPLTKKISTSKFKYSRNDHN